MNTFSAVLLIVTIITTADRRDVVYRLPMPDMATCEAALHEFITHKFPSEIGAVGLDATCRGKLTEDSPS
jgi:hypothetical protein